MVACSVAATGGSADDGKRALQRDAQAESG
jgi:hypothetical protein